MGSYSLANPTDNRLAVTDHGIGLTSSISGNNSALGYAPNSGFRNAKDVSYLAAGSRQASGGSTLTESGAVNMAGGKIGGNVSNAWNHSTSFSESNSFSDNSNTTLNMTDGGAIDSAFDFASKSLDAIRTADAGANAGFSQLLDVTDNIFARAQSGAYDQLDRIGQAQEYQADKTIDLIGLITGAQQQANSQAMNLLDTIGSAFSSTQTQAASNQADASGIISQKSMLIIGGMVLAGFAIMRMRG